jgi:hypothetical protein
MPASATNPAPSDVATASPSVKIAGGKLVRFTRHPQALAKACVLELQACARFVLEVLLTSADKDGITWVSAKEIASITPRSSHVPRYSLPSILRGLRTLRAVGLLRWERVAPLHSFPRRNRDRSVTPGEGKWSQGGGRVWVVDVLKLRSLSEPDDAGTTLAGSITHDRSGSITHDRPIKDHGSLSENLYKQDRASPRARPAPPAPRVASGTPGSAGGARSAVAPSVSEAPPARPTAARVASETPHAAVAVQAPRPLPSSRTETQPHGGKGEQEKCQDRPMTRAELAEALVKLDAALKTPGGVRRRLRV